MPESSSLLVGLNDVQKSAVIHEGSPLLILAGAGSGKTRVLIHKIAYLIREKLVAPHHILAVTFTNKAAGEMKHRMERFLPSGSAAAVWQGLWMGTFHAIGLRIIRQHAPKLGYGGDVVVYDTHDQVEVVKTCLKTLGWDKKSISPSAVSHFINRVKCDAPDGAAPKDLASSYFEKQAIQVFALYQEHLQKNQALDFSDLLIKPLELFEKYPAIIAQYQSRLKYIFVDEYQDTNKAQYEFLKALGGGGAELTVVGDEDQSIYRFRGADIQNILQFKRDFPDATIIRLEQNYRSTKTILHAANNVVKHNEQRLGKNLWSDNADGEKIVVFTARDDREEANYVVDEIARLTSRVPLDQIAIFYRTNAQSRVFEEALRRANIPYRIYGGLNFFERKEIKDLIAYLRLLVNPKDSVSFKRIVNVPPRGIGATSVEALEALATQHGTPMFEVLSAHRHLLSPRARAPFERFLALYSRLYDAMRKTSLTDLVNIVMTETGYETMLKEEETYESKGRLENIDEFLNAIADYQSHTPTASLSGFLEQITLDTSRSDETTAEKPLTLMTLHLAKGLEFPFVFIVGLEENLLPHTRSLDNPDDIEEERRLIYVGMTRAMTRLTLSLAHRRYAHGREQMNLRSRFLDELPPEVIIERGAARFSQPTYDDNNDPFLHDDSENTHKSKTGYLSAKAWKPSAATRPAPTFITPKMAATPPSSRPSARPTPQASGLYRIGHLVRHPQFGRGVIRGLEGDAGNPKITILFENGQMKKLLGKYAQLEVL